MQDDLLIPRYMHTAHKTFLNKLLALKESLPEPSPMLERLIADTRATCAHYKKSLEETRI